MSPHECLSALVSNHQHSWAFISMLLWHHHSLGMLMSAPCSWRLLSSHECSLFHGTKLTSVHGCSWVLMAVHECSWLLLAAYECTWMLTGAHDCTWAFMSSHEHSWAWHHGAMKTHESLRAVTSLAPWGHWHSSALMSAFDTIAPYSWALMSVHERIYECLWELMNAPESL